MEGRGGKEGISRLEEKGGGGNRDGGDLKGDGRGPSAAGNSGEAGGAPGWRRREGSEVGGVSGRREAGRADAPGEGAGQEGEGEREREKCRGCSGGGGSSSDSGDGGGGSAPTRSSLRAPPSSRGESHRQRPGTRPDDASDPGPSAAPRSPRGGTGTQIR